MNWHKRIELWLMLALVIAGLFFVFGHRSSDEEKAGFSDNVVTSEKEAAPLKIHRCVIERDRNNARFDIEVQVRNDGAQKLVLQSPQARLLNAKGREIAAFFLPFDAPPEVPPNSTQDVQLRYWLDAVDLQGALTLEVNGKSVAVKNAKPLDLSTLKNAEKKTVTGLDW